MNPYRQLSTDQLMKVLEENQAQIAMWLGGRHHSLMMTGSHARIVRGCRKELARRGVST